VKAAAVCLHWACAPSCPDRRLGHAQVLNGNEPKRSTHAATHSRRNDFVVSSRTSTGRIGLGPTSCRPSIPRRACRSARATFLLENPGCRPGTRCGYRGRATSAGAGVGHDGAMKNRQPRTRSKGDRAGRLPVLRFTKPMPSSMLREDINIVRRAADGDHQSDLHRSPAGRFKNIHLVGALSGPARTSIFFLRRRSGMVASSSRARKADRFQTSRPLKLGPIGSSSISIRHGEAQGPGINNVG